MKLEGQQTVLKPMSLDQVTERYLSWLNNPEVTRYLSTGRQTLEQLRQYVAERIQNPNVRFWTIHDRQNDLHIGNVKLEPIFWDVARATFGILIGDPEYWSRGICTEVTNIVTQHAFRDLRLKKVDLGVVGDNRAAIRAYEKAGFHVEGHFRRHAMLHDEVVDAIYMARFAEP